jgi:hypothetical protein
VTKTTQANRDEAHQVVSRVAIFIGLRGNEWVIFDAEGLTNPHIA